MEIGRRDELVEYLSSGKYSQEYDKSQKRALRRAAESFVLKEDRVLYHLRDGMYLDNPAKRIEMAQKVIVGNEEKFNILRELHCGLTGGHFGINKTQEKVAQRYWWPGHSKDVEDYCKTCDTCQKANATNRPKVAELHPIPVSSKLGHRWCIDLIGPMKETPCGNRYIVVATEYLTRFPVVGALANKDALSVGKFIFESIICMFGPMRLLQHDQGREFCNALNKFICNKLGIKAAISSAYHPQTNGLTERFNQTLETQLMKLAPGVNWDDHIQGITYAYRVSVQASTKRTPHEMMFGVLPLLPALLDFDEGFSVAIAQRIASVSNALVQCRAMGLANLKCAQQKQKKQFDIKHHGPFFEIGDKVLLYNKRRDGRQGDCVQARFMPSAPGQYYTIHASLGSGVYELYNPSTQSVLASKVNGIHLKRYHQRELDEQAHPSENVEQLTIQAPAPAPTAITGHAWNAFDTPGNNATRPTNRSRLRGGLSTVIGRSISSVGIRTRPGETVAAYRQDGLIRMQRTPPSTPPPPCLRAGRTVQMAGACSTSSAVSLASIAVGVTVTVTVRIMDSSEDWYPRETLDYTVKLEETLEGLFAQLAQRMQVPADELDLIRVGDRMYFNSRDVPALVELENGDVLECSHSEKCKGKRWTLRPEQIVLRDKIAEKNRPLLAMMKSPLVKEYALQLIEGAIRTTRCVDYQKLSPQEKIYAENIYEIGPLLATGEVNENGLTDVTSHFDQMSESIHDAQQRPPGSFIRWVVFYEVMKYSLQLLYGISEDCAENIIRTRGYDGYLELQMKSSIEDHNDDDVDCHGESISVHSVPDSDGNDQHCLSDQDLFASPARPRERHSSSESPEDGDIGDKHERDAPQQQAIAGEHRPEHSETAESSQPSETVATARPVTRSASQQQNQLQSRPIRHDRTTQEKNRRPVAGRAGKNLRADEPTYCLCRQVSYGKMVACDNSACDVEWFHFECVNLTSEPKAKWYCPNCRRMGDGPNTCMKLSFKKTQIVPWPATIIKIETFQSYSITLLYQCFVFNDVLY